MTTVRTGISPVVMKTPSAPRQHPQLTTVDEVEIGAALPIEYASPRDVILDPKAMAFDRAYTYELDGTTYVVMRRHDERLDFYELPNR